MPSLLFYRTTTESRIVSVPLPLLSFFAFGFSEATHPSSA
jgi:hypothetical protein